MPLLNPTGDYWIAGIAGSGFYFGTFGSSGGNPVINTVFSAIQAGERAFVDNKNAVFQRLDGSPRLVQIDVTTSIESVVGGPISTVRGGGGVWAAFLADNGVTGVFSSTGLSLPAAGLADVGPDGAIAIAADYQSDGPWYVHEKSGTEWPLTSNSALNIQLLGAGRAFWTEDGEPFVIGVPLPAPISRPFWFPKMINTPSGWWILYQESVDNRLVFHPVDSTTGYVVATAANIFNPDIVILPSGNIRVIWSSNQGETPDALNVKDLSFSDLRTDLGTSIIGGGSVGNGTTTSGSNVSTATLTSTATFQVADASIVVATLEEPVTPTLPLESGYGRLVHPDLGAFDYEVKPDEWSNIDADIIIPPVWASTRTMTGASNVLWNGSIQDVVAVESWKPVGGLSMPITQLRMRLLIWQTPVDPSIGYVEWWPNYISARGFKVIPVSLTVGGQTVTLNDVINAKLPDGSPDGWVTDQVTMTYRLVGRA